MTKSEAWDIVVSEVETARGLTKSPEELYYWIIGTVECCMKQINPDPEEDDRK